MFNCPCCNHLTLSEEPSGSFEICLVCFWEDDNVQFNDPYFEGGANKVSLNQAKINFKALGSSSKDFLKDVRSPLKEEMPNS